MNNKVEDEKMKPGAERTLEPKLRFPEFRDAGEWVPKTIGDFLTESRIPGSKGDVAKKITVKLWGNGVFAKSETTRGSVNTQYFRRKAGQFIYSKLDFLNQAFGIIPTNLDNFESTVDLPCFDFSEGLNPIFLLEYVKRKEFYEKHGETADGSRKAKRIQIETFLSFPILLPEPDEQQKIADCLSSIDELVTLEAQKFDTLKAFKKGLMQQLFPAEGETLPKLRFPEFLDAGEWEKKRLGELLLGHPDYGVNAPAVPYTEDLPAYLRITDISDEGYFLCNKKTSVAINATDENYLSEGNIVLARTGASVGKSYKYRKEDGNLVFAGFLIRIKPDPKKIDSTFLFNFLSTQQYWKWVGVISARSGQPGINGNEYAALPIQVPPHERELSEQQKIADCLSSLDDFIIAQTQKLDTLKSHKKALMQQLFPAFGEVQ